MNQIPTSVLNGLTIGKQTARFLSALRCLGLTLTITTTAIFHTARAEVSLPSVFSSHMVLQQGKPVSVWGWASPHETIKVEFLGETRVTQADERGEWKVALPSMNAGGPYAMTVSGLNTIKFEDVMVGEVWICSGQSNMALTIGAADNGATEVAEANYPGLRLLKVPRRSASQKQLNFEASWQVCSPAVVAKGFSACGYYFGRALSKELGVTVGLIESDWGGTYIEPWISPEGFASVPALTKENERMKLADPHSADHQRCLVEFLNIMQDWVSKSRQASARFEPEPVMPAFPVELQPLQGRDDPTALYNTMIYPLIPFAVRGFVWYQGEQNLGDGMLYADKMKALIGGWRRLWNDNSLPFYFVQIAPFNYKGHNKFDEPELWEAQVVAAQTIPNTGMVVINDIGTLNNVHPPNKQEVGRRLSLWALSKTYGRSNLVCSGPVFKEIKIQGDKIRVTFDTVTNDLTSRDRKPLNWFELIDAHGGGFVAAEAKIDGQSVVLSAPSVKHPVAMRFAWSMLAQPNLMNSAGLPAGAFRAGKVPEGDLQRK